MNMCTYTETHISKCTSCLHVCTRTRLHVHVSAYTHREHNYRQEEVLEPQENITNDSMPIDAKTWMKWVYLPEKQITESNWSS